MKAEPRNDGVIIAQGGSSQGFALYIKDGKLALATRIDGKQVIITTEEKLPESKISVRAHLAKNGAMSIEVDGKVVASGKSGSAMTQMPQDGLQVGSDTDGAVGDYKAPNTFKGKITGATLEVGK